MAHGVVSANASGKFKDLVCGFAGLGLAQPRHELCAERTVEVLASAHIHQSPFGEAEHAHYNLKNKNVVLNSNCIDLGFSKNANQVLLELTKMHKVDRPATSKQTISTC